MLSKALVTSNEFNTFHYMFPYNLTLKRPFKKDRTPLKRALKGDCKGRVFPGGECPARMGCVLGGAAGIATAFNAPIGAILCLGGSFEVSKIGSLKKAVL